MATSVASHTCRLFQEAAHAKELVHWDAKIRERNDELARLTSENTQCLTSVADFTRSQMDMEKTLANTQVYFNADCTKNGSGLALMHVLVCLTAPASICSRQCRGL